MNGILPADLLSCVIRPALGEIGLGGQGAEELMLGTACQESGCGRRLLQAGNAPGVRGPALGVWQIEPRSHDDLRRNFLAARSELMARLDGLLAPGIPAESQLSGNLFYACAVARLIYYRTPDPLPAAGDLAAQAAFYKAHYNTAGGAATAAEYVANARTAGLAA